MVDNSSCTYCMFGGFKQRREVNEDSITQTFYQLSSSYLIVSLKRFICFFGKNFFWNVFLTFWCHFLCSTKTIHHLLLIWNLHLIVHAVVWFFFFSCVSTLWGDPFRVRISGSQEELAGFLKDDASFKLPEMVDETLCLCCVLLQYCQRNANV